MRNPTRVRESASIGVRKGRLEMSPPTGPSEECREQASSHCLSLDPLQSGLRGSIPRSDTKPLWASDAACLAVLPAAGASRSYTPTRPVPTRANPRITGPNPLMSPESRVPSPTLALGRSADTYTYTHIDIPSSPATLRPPPHHAANGQTGRMRGLLYTSPIFTSFRRT